MIRCVFAGSKRYPESLHCRALPPRQRVDPALSEATAHLRSFVGGEARVPAELLGAFDDAGPLLAFARRKVPTIVQIRYPSTEIVFPRAA